MKSIEVVKKEDLSLPVTSDLVVIARNSSEMAQAQEQLLSCTRQTA